MQVFHGKSVLGGIAIGKIHLYQKQNQPIMRETAEDAAAEIHRFGSARKQAAEQIRQLQEKTLHQMGESEAAILEAHMTMLEDVVFIQSVENIIRQQVSAEYAVSVASEQFARMFREMDDSYMQERAADVKDVSDRILNILSGAENQGLNLTEPVILVAEDLAPSETVQLDKAKVLAFVTRKGSFTSHTAILAKTMGIPTLVQTEFEPREIAGKMGAVDGFSGELYIEPEETVLQELLYRKEKAEEQKALLQQLKGKEDVTLDGKAIGLFANIGNGGDLALVQENDARGIGLFRSEFLYLEKIDYPTEEEQFQAYKTVARAMGDRKVVIRTLDIGADKQTDYFGIPKEENPALGFRAIRICLDRPEIFKTQLRAIFRASVYGNVAVMYPMIISLEEVMKIKILVNEVKRELQSEGIDYRDIEEGIMIETPAAVMLSEELAREVDFFSIGTNDLAQYTLAVDRQNANISEWYDAKHPAVLKMIKLVVDNAHKAGIKVGICGELAADTALTATLLEMGVDALSVAPGELLSVRKAIRETSLGES